MTDELHPQIALLLRQFARELRETVPSPELDARIGQLVATRRPISALKARRLLPAWVPAYAAAAGFVTLAICVGILIGMKLEHIRNLTAANLDAVDEVWPPADLTMWPTDSVSLKIPAEYSPQGTLVAVDPDSKRTGTRYWIDVVVANDGTFRIEGIVPVDPAHLGKGDDGVTLQSP